MSGNQRAYRDTNSPLQPLTPISMNSEFSSHMGDDASLKPWIDQINSHRGKLETKPKLQTQQAYQGQQCCASNIQLNPNPVKMKRQVCACAAAAHIGSTIPKSKPLYHRGKCPPILKTISRMHFVLEQVGMVKYWDYLKQYGIDSNKFQKLTSKDFEYLGIRNREDLGKLLKAVEMARNLY